ncbi:uncharacterized protein LOC129976106 [Argiope bruennichi]|uniref:Uncharacterized protein n=1 Tax=Argiope bruennichi TaxID=94029 RepID=A0A8T0DZL9_ARGBR|nr:uncharacterized protein LOC129976106 [Argiope bruennichi]KAF8763235.1 hypothetical protein HNY73_021438 [Argiope bruennichi]
MWSKVIPTVLCVFCFLAVIRSQVLKPVDLADYYDCWTYAECFTDSSAHQGIMDCFNSIGKDVEPMFKFVNETFYTYHTDSIAEAMEEYCDLCGDAKYYAYEETLNGIFYYQNKACRARLRRQCSSSEKMLKCFFKLLDGLKDQGLC